MKFRNALLFSSIVACTFHTAARLQGLAKGDEIKIETLLSFRLSYLICLKSISSIKQYKSVCHNPYSTINVEITRI